MPCVQKIVWPEFSAETGIMLITMVKDEQDMLRHWIGHYRSCVENPSFLIVDDGSVLPVASWVNDEFPEQNISVLSLPPSDFSDRYKSGVLSALAAMSVGRYKVVIASDVDEVVMSCRPIEKNTLGKVLLSLDTGIKTALGVLVVQDVRTEGRFDFSRPLLGQRSYGFFHTPSTKPAIWSQAIGAFSVGQHLVLDSVSEVRPDLVLAHLKFVDADEFTARQKTRNLLSFSQDHNPNHGVHWRREVQDASRFEFFGRLANSQEPVSFSDGLKRFMDEICEEKDGVLVRNGSPSEVGPVKLALFC